MSERVKTGVEFSITGQSRPVAFSLLSKYTTAKQGPGVFPSTADKWPLPSSVAPCRVKSLKSN